MDAVQCPMAWHNVPALIVVLSMTTDHILDHTPTRGIDVTVFRARERKRVEMLQVRLDTERELLALDTELSTLRRNREQASGKVQTRVDLLALASASGTGPIQHRERRTQDQRSTKLCRPLAPLSKSI